MRYIHTYKICIEMFHTGTVKYSSRLPTILNSTDPEALFFPEGEKIINFGQTQSKQEFLSVTLKDPISLFIPSIASKFYKTLWGSLVLNLLPVVC